MMKGVEICYGRDSAKAKLASGGEEREEAKTTESLPLPTVYFSKVKLKIRFFLSLNFVPILN
jgi:hypothetical protein